MTIKRLAAHGSVEVCLLCRCSLTGDKTCDFNCACHDYCACGEEIPQWFPNEGDRQYWNEKHGNHSYPVDPELESSERMARRLDGAEDEEDRI